MRLNRHMSEGQLESEREIKLRPGRAGEPGEMTQPGEGRLGRKLERGRKER